MTNNDFLRRLRYALNIKDNIMVQIFKKGNIIVTREDVIDYLKKDIDEGFKKISNADYQQLTNTTPYMKVSKNHLLF